MKKLFIASLLISNVCLFAQNTQGDIVTFQPKQYTSSIMKTFNFNTPTYTYTQLQFYNKNDFSIYNRTTMMNDNFSVYNNKIEYKNSSIIPENLIATVKMDSFNPNTTDSFEGALLTGALNLLASLFSSK